MTKVSVDEFNTIIEAELPWAQDYGIEASDMGDARAVLRIPYDDKMLRPGGTISGPTMMTLADATMYAVILSAIGPVKLAVTTNFNIDFLRRPKPADLLAEGRMLKLGKRLAVMAVDIRSDGAADLVAHATGTYSIPPDGR